MQRITVHPDVFGGKPIIRDMRISVEFVISLMYQRATPEELLDDYPELDSGDRALLKLAASSNQALIASASDFGELTYLHNAAYAGLIWLMDVPAPRRIE